MKMPTTVGRHFLDFESQSKVQMRCYVDKACVSIVDWDVS